MPATADKQLDLATFTTWINAIQQQPAWRARADREADYYDGNQLDSEVLNRQRELGIPAAIEPIIKPTIDSVLGLEVKQRTDWKVVPDSDKLGDDDVSDALNHKLNQAEKRAKADAACSEGFRGQATVGIGWVEVSRCQDPFKFPYRCTPVHRNEIFWDWLSKEVDLSDARYLVRRKWIDIELAKLMFPKKKDLIQSVGNGWKGIDFDTLTPDGGTSTDLAMSYDMERGWSVEEQEWRDLDNSRVCLFEVWYRHWERVKVIKIPQDGRIVEFESTNPAHIMAVAVAGMQVEEAVVGKVRLAWFCGPHLLSDEPSPYSHRNFPYVPFWGFREDRTNVPYGMVRGMVYLQDEINARISKMQWMLSARSVVRTDGIVMDDDENFRNMVGRPDSDVVLDPAAAAQPGAKYEVERNFELSRQQYDRLQDAREAIKRVSGISENFEGQQSGQSGLAVNSLIEQSVQAITDLMDNFRTGRTMVGELLLSMIIQDTTAREEMMIPGGVVSEDRSVVLNDPVSDPDTGIEYLNNDVQRTMLKVNMEDVPSTPSFRAQQLAAMSEAFKSMPQMYQQATMPFLFALMDVPNKKEILDIIKGLSSVPDEEAIQKRIDEAVNAKGLEIKSREVDIKERLTAAQIEDITANAVAKTIQAIYSGAQAGMQIAQVPGVAPIADQLLMSSGFVDKDAPPIVSGGVPMQNIQYQPQQNTSPMFPPRANPEQVENGSTGEIAPMQADIGVNQGIEKEGVQ